MRNDLLKKIIVLGIVLLFIGVVITPAIAIDTKTSSFKEMIVEEKTITSLSRGKTFYVGGNGPGNYTRIQDAINDTNSGDTVFVYNDSSPYYETLMVDKSIDLIGEDRDTTIINGSGIGDVVVSVIKNWVNITGFTVTGSGENEVGVGITLNNVQNCSIFNNIVSGIYWPYYPNYWYSIYLDSSNRNNITGNIVSSNYTYTWYGIYLYFSKRNTINENIVSNNHWGIYLYSSSNNKIIGNTAVNNCIGIFLDSTPLPYNPSRYNNIIGNNASNNRYGIYLHYKTKENNITGNTISSNNIHGIYLDCSTSGHNIISNNISLNNGYGIFLIESRGNKITGNTMIEDGIFISGGSLVDWNAHTIDTSNTVNGKSVYYWKDQTGGTIPSDAGQVFLVSCTNVIVENLDFNKCDVGIELAFSSNCKITGNSASNNKYGIYLLHSTENAVTNNTASNNGDGIYLDGCSSNTITGNNASNNGNGIYIWYSSSNTITGNDASNNKYGIRLLHSTKNTITDNTASNNRNGIYIDYFAQGNTITGNTISNNGGGIDLSWYCSSNTIRSNTISNNSGGINLDWYSDSNIITDNGIISNNGDGIYLKDSSNNIIKGNTISSNNRTSISIHSLFLGSHNNSIIGNSISNNGEGIRLSVSSSNNIIYHNNLINNTQNAYDECNNTWDDGEYGNYWSDYEERYPKARKLLKGIWDTPYEIPGGDNKDMCPLIKQWPDSVSKTMPKNKAINFNLLSWLFERFTNAFPILQKMLLYLLK